jgi:hypothetical protein
VDPARAPRHNAPMFETEASDTEMRELILRYVMVGEGRHLDLLHGNFARWEEPKRADFIDALVRDAHQITDRELGFLFDMEWRCRITAAWMIGISHRATLRDRLAKLLLASELTYAGQGYCVALALLGTDEDAEILAAYLDRYLPPPMRHYDQSWAIGALMHLDERLGTHHAAPYLLPDGPWDQWAQGKLDADGQKERIGQLCSLVTDHQDPAALA